jgi:hypothetical protein
LRHARVMNSRCRDCGAPFYPRLFRRWNDDGTVTARHAGTNRVCHIESGALCAIIDGLSERIGYPIDRVAIEGQRKATRRLTDDVMSAGGGAIGLITRSRLGSGLATEIILGVGRTAGHGLPQATEYRRGRAMRLKVEDPYCIPMVVGDAWGSFESVHNVTAEAAWRSGPDWVEIELEKVRDGMVWEDPLRFQVEPIARLPGDVNYERCARCGIPVEVTRAICWDLENGIVTNKLTGRREATVIVESVNAVLRELHSELGDEVPFMVQDILKEYTAAGIDTQAAEGIRSGGYRSALDHLRVRGMGNPVKASCYKGDLTVRIDNPFSGIILAGMIRGVYRAAEGVEGRCEWAIHPDGYMVVSVSPRAA